MIKYMPFFILLLFFNNATAQTELVPNGSFEIITTCSSALIENAIGWFNCGETPDLCNACATNSAFGVPSNVIGFQYASDGVGYADLLTYSFTGLYREIIGTKLNQQLVPGNSYKVSFKTARACNTNGYCIATNNIGVLFTTVAYSQSNPVPAKNFAHLNIDTVVTDTAIWTVLSEYWTADSAYQYIMLGNFFSDNQTDTIHLDNRSAFAVYYIDEVSVLDEGKVAIDETNSNEFEISWQGNTIFLNAGAKSFDSGYIINTLGQVVYEIGSTATGSTIEINLKNLSTGMYYIMMKSEGNQFLKKILNP